MDKSRTDKRKLTQENLDVAKKRKSEKKRKTESLLIAEINKPIKTKYVKAGIDKTKRSCKFRLCSDRDETINPNISECNTLVQR